MRAQPYYIILGGYFQGIIKMRNVIYSFKTAI